MRNFQATCIKTEEDLNLTVLRKQSLIIMITIQIILPILSKDARLPVQLQRAMAAEAEAAREARAKVGGCGHGAGGGDGQDTGQG